MSTPDVTHRRAFVLHSGGLDSSTALYIAMEQSNKAFRAKEILTPNLIQDDVVSISVDYGQRHAREIVFARELCAQVGIEHSEIKMAHPPKSMLTDDTAPIPDSSYSDLPHGISPTYVPFRNGQLLSRIVGVAQGWVMETEKEGNEEQSLVERLALGANVVAEATVWFGAHAEDAQNWAYPDCTPEFIGAMAAAILIGTYNKVRLITPFTHFTKGAIIREGENLKVPYELTWSCYNGAEKHCGICPTCRARKDAFKEAGVFDPTEYSV